MYPPRLPPSSPPLAPPAPPPLLPAAAATAGLLQLQHLPSQMLRQPVPELPRTVVASKFPLVLDAFLVVGLHVLRAFHEEADVDCA